MFISRMHGASSTQFSVTYVCKVIQFCVLFNGFLAELPAILEIFFTNVISDCIEAKAIPGSLPFLKEHSKSIICYLDWRPYRLVGDGGEPQSGTRHNIVTHLYGSTGT